jgi:hypothetical protein
MLLDLRNDEQLTQMLNTQYRMKANEAYMVACMASTEAVFQFPAWDLVRIGSRVVSRWTKVSKDGLVDDSSQDWPCRWLVAGGKIIKGRMVALKDSPVWQALGYGAGGYEGTLGHPFPPFAYRSGYGLAEIDRNESLELGVLEDGQKVKPRKIPDAGLGGDVALRDVSDETIDLWRAEKERRALGGKRLTVAERLSALGVPASDYISTSILSERGA